MHAARNPRGIRRRPRLLRRSASNSDFGLALWLTYAGGVIAGAPTQPTRAPSRGDAELCRRLDGISTA